MAIAYVDTSCFVAIAFGERSPIARRIRNFDELVSSAFVEAEIRSAFKRERMPFDAEILARISLVSPDRSLSVEIERVLEAAYVRGGDCWHLASALYLASDPSALTFLTLDEPQRRIAKLLGFQV